MGILSKTGSKIKPHVQGIRYDTSVYGSVIPVIYGRTRVAPKMVFSNGFVVHKASRGKKGGGMKGGGKHGSSASGGSVTYSANFDWLLGFAPLVFIGSVWRNKDNFWGAAVGSQVFTAGTNFTISNSPGPVIGIIAVTKTVNVNVTFNDYGAPGSLTINNQQPKPLYKTGLGNPIFFEGIAPGGGNWASWTSPDIGIYNLSGGKSTASTTAANAATVANPVTVYYWYSLVSGSPLAAAGLIFEGTLGSNPLAPGLPLTYPEFSGISGPSTDLGSGNTTPNDNFEALGLFPFALTGDVHPPDIILDIILPGNPVNAFGQLGSPYNWNHGLGFNTTLVPSAKPQFPNTLFDPPLLTSYGSPIVQSAGLATARSYCQAYGIFISGIMDTQRAASDWLTELCEIANLAPVWNGSLLNFVPRCEVSFAGNGATFTAPTASGPVYDLDDRHFISKGQSAPVTITRKRAPDAYNILSIEHLNRANNYAIEITTVRDQGDIFRRGPIKAAVKQLHWIQDSATAVKVAWPLLRRQTLVERLEFTFALPITHSLLDPMDLVTLTDSRLGISKFPVRLTAIRESDTRELECTAEPYFYGAHSPNPQLPSGVPINNSFNQSADPGSTNPPIIIEANGLLNNNQNQGSLIVTTSGSNPNYGGCAIFMSTDGGNTYQQVGVVNGNPVMGTLSQDLGTSPDPDAIDTVNVDLTQSSGTLANFSAAQRDAFQSLCYIAGGGTITVNGQVLTVPYELISYATATLITGNVYQLPPTIRRGVGNTPNVSHAFGSQFLFLDPNEYSVIPLPRSLIGQTLFFKLAAYNQFLANQQTLDLVTAYSFTPSGQVGGSQSANQDQLGYTTTPSQLIFQGKTGGWPNQPTWTDPTKLYLVSPFTANFSTGPVLYSPTTTPQAIPGTAPEALYVTIYDPTRTGSGPLSIDTAPTKFNTAGYTRVGKIQILNTSTGGGSAQLPIRTLYSVTPAADGSTTAFTIVGGVPNNNVYVDVFLNGILQTPGLHYTLQANQIFFASAPKGAAGSTPADRIEVVF